MQPAQQIRVEFTVEPLGGESGDAGSPASLAAAEAVERAGLRASRQSSATSVQGPVQAVSLAMADLVRSAMDAGATSVSLRVARTV
jgi:hypothetical protein